MSKCLAAHTNPGANFPGYLNFTREDDGSVTVHFRADPSTSKGEYICGYAADRGKLGRCTPGDDRCNNYCNMAPQKGPMQKAPLGCEQINEGNAGTLKLSAEAFSTFLGEATDTKQLREVLGGA